MVTSDLAMRRFDIAVIALLVAVTLAIGLIDPNDQFLSANDIYIFKQIHHYFEMFSWRAQDVASLPALIDKVARFIFWFFYYFHGAPPQLYQAPLFGLLDATGVSFRPIYGQAMMTIFVAITIVLFWLCLRRAAVASPIAASAALIVACSPMLASISRGFGTGWIANVPFCQALGLYAFMRLREGQGRWLVGLALTHIVLSDPISFLMIGALVAAWFLPDRWLGMRLSVQVGLQRLRKLTPPPVWLLPVIAIISVVLWNVVRTRYAAAIPSEPSLFVYPFAKYFEVNVGHTGRFGPDDWLRVATISLGIWAPIGLPVALGTAVILRRHPTADPFTLRWALISSIGFGLMFYLLSYGGMGSKAMPYMGYPIYTVLPFVTLLALAGDQIAADGARRRLVTGVLAVFAASGLLTTVSYIWQRPLVPGAALLTFDEADADFIGLRRTYYGDLAAGAAVRYAIERSTSAAEVHPLRMLYVRKPGNVHFDAFWMYAGLEYGGRWFELRSGRLPKIEVTLMEPGGTPPTWLLQKIEPVHKVIEASKELSLASFDGCRAAACVVLDTTGKADDEELLRQLGQIPQLRIIRDDHSTYDISIVGDASLLPVTGVTDGRDLEHKFRQDFPSLWDYVPPPDPLGFLKKFQGAISKR